MKIILLPSIRLFMPSYNFWVIIDKIKKCTYELEIHEVKL